MSIPLTIIAILAAVTAWVALSVALAVILGRMIRYRDLQVPTNNNFDEENNN